MGGNVEENKTKSNQLICIKEGMTSLYDTNGNQISVTVLKIIPNIVAEIKENKVKIVYNKKTANRINNCKKGFLKKSNIEPVYNSTYELDLSQISTPKVGNELCPNFNIGDFVDISSKSKGKGFQGVIKRYGFSGGPAAHGSQFHRSPGSIGNRATPARVFKEKKLPGHMGSKLVTVRNLKVFSVNFNESFILVSGSVPGGKSGFVTIKSNILK